jgi:DNA modification methylase
MPAGTKLSRSNVVAVNSKCEQLPLASAKPAVTKLRAHSAAKIRTLAASVSKNGLITPIIVNKSGVIVDGHARVEVARRLGWTDITAIRVEHLTDEDLRLFAIAANKLPADATWDMDVLRRELESIELALPAVDLTLSGFSVPEIDSLRGAYAAAQLNDLVDDLPEVAPPDAAVSRTGDLFLLKGHRLVCGDATDADVLAQLMGEDQADQLFTDPPYNVAVDGHVSGNGKICHREFQMASGEMTASEFTSFLRESLSAAATHMIDGALAYVCMDHAHLDQLLEVGAEVFTERKAICVWDKGSGGMGSLYRNAHELVTVFKKGTGKHINNIALGKHGRNRTTIWRYPGIAQLGKGRAKALSLHPTVKPVALVADALLDASPRGGIVLDPFGGSGTTLVSAETTGRFARSVEIDPVYVDTIVTRFEALTGLPAIHAASGRTFAELRAERACAKPPYVAGAGACHE